MGGHGNRSGALVVARFGRRGRTNEEAAAGLLGFAMKRSSGWRLAGWAGLGRIQICQPDLPMPVFPDETGAGHQTMPNATQKYSKLGFPKKKLGVYRISCIAISRCAVFEVMIRIRSAHVFIEISMC
jgi:hypothetical protein